MGMLFQIYKFENKKLSKKSKIMKKSKSLIYQKIKNTASISNDDELIMNKIYKFSSNNKMKKMEIILYIVFHDVEKGFYIDIGANDPIKESITKEFYKNGWHGINVEPVPYLYKLLLKYRPNDINGGMAAGERDDNNITIYI